MPLTSPMHHRLPDRITRSVAAACLGLAGILSSLAESPVKALEMKPGPVGIVCLLSLSSPQYSLSRLSEFACWTNPEVKGVMLRLPWSMVEATEGHFDFSLFDQGVTLARQYGKYVGLSICAGKRTPDWFYEAGGTKFDFQKERRGGATDAMAMPLPWDPVFQKKWGALIGAFGQRYDTVREVAYIVMTGPGRDFETYFVDSPADIARFNTMDGGTLWGRAARTIAGLYAAAFPQTKLIYLIGPPTPTPEGHAIIGDVVTDLLAQYPNHFGVANASLSPVDQPHPSSLMVRDNAARTSVGFQMLLPSKGGKTMHGGSLADALHIGVAYKAHYIEVYRADCDDPAQQKTLHEANAGLLADAGLPHALPSTASGATRSTP